MNTYKDKVEEQKKLIGAKLLTLRPHIPHDVKVDWGRANGKGTTTVYAYFKGDVADIIVGEKMLAEMPKMAGLTKNKVAEILEKANIKS